MTEKRFRQLLEGYLRESLTSTELKVFLHAVQRKGSGEVLAEHLEKMITRPSTHEDPTRAQASLDVFMAKIKQGPAVVVKLKPSTGRQLWLGKPLRYVAILATLAIGLAVLLIGRGDRTEQAKIPIIASVLAPADHQAQLRLGDGSILVLDSQTVDGRQLARDGATYSADSNTLLYKTNYQDGSQAGTSELATGRGYQVRVLLPDGSRVWLNAKSRLRYFNTAASGAREVVLDGEGYFEVSPEPSNPFIVKTTVATVAVIGTSFNVRAYQQDSSLTTGIYEGSVQVTGDRKKTTIKAGEQLTIYPNGSWQKNGAATLQAAIGWKNNLFYFQRAGLPTILKELSRWYNLDYEIAPGNTRTFSGKIPRTEDLSTVLEVLKEGGITYRKEGNKLVFFR